MVRGGTLIKNGSARVNLDGAGLSSSSLDRPGQKRF